MKMVDLAMDVKVWYSCTRAFVKLWAEQLRGGLGELAVRRSLLKIDCSSFAFGLRSWFCKLLAENCLIGKLQQTNLRFKDRWLLAPSKKYHAWYFSGISASPAFAGGCSFTFFHDKNKKHSREIYCSSTKFSDNYGSSVLRLSSNHLTLCLFLSNLARRLNHLKSRELFIFHHYLPPPISLASSWPHSPGCFGCWMFQTVHLGSWQWRCSCSSCRATPSAGSPPPSSGCSTS